MHARPPSRARRPLASAVTVQDPAPRRTAGEGMHVQVVVVVGVTSASAAPVAASTISTASTAATAAATCSSAATAAATAAACNSPCCWWCRKYASRTGLRAVAEESATLVSILRRNSAAEPWV